MKHPACFTVRLLGALGGLIGGAFAGLLLFVVTIIFTGITFGLDNIWPAALVGSGIGTVAGFLFPRVGKGLINLFIGF